MSLTVRATRPADLAACLEIVHGKYAFSDADQQAALVCWAHLLESRAGLSRVVTTLDGPRAGQILVFVLGAFVTDDFMREALTTLPPHLGLQVVRRWRSGKRVHLNNREIARDNAGEGLNLLTIAYGTAPGLPPDVDLQARAIMAAAAFGLFSGYRIKHVVQEGLGTELHAYLLTTGVRVVRSFPIRPPVVPCRRDGPPTHVYGLSRDGRPEDLGPHWWMFFNPPEPRLGLSEGEKETLERALEDETDDDMARSLGISIWTVKKRWQNLYSKVEQVAPAVLSGLGGGDESGGTAGVERRRHLLAYVRQHLEEIRPRELLRR
jgi:hypothetical protein